MSVMRWLRHLDGIVRDLLYPGEWGCQCGMTRGNYVAECGCPRREQRPDLYGPQQGADG